MSWFGQVLHVLRKDLRVLRWGALLYVAVAALTVAAALLSWERWAPMLWVIALCMLGALLVGQAVHNDSPSRVDSFWATRPLSASAVFGAKLLMALLVLALPAVGEWLHLRSHDISAGFATSLAARPIAAYMVLLAAGLMVGVLTPNMKAFIVTFGAVVLFGTVALQFLPFWFGSEVGPIPGQLLLAIVVAGIVLLGWQQYRTREPRRGYAFAALLVLLMLLIPVQTRARASWNSVRPPLPASVDTIGLRIEEASLSPGPRRLLNIIMSIDDVPAPKQYSVYVQDVLIATDEQPQAALLRFHGTWFREDLGASDGNTLLNRGRTNMNLTYEVTASEAALLERSDARVVVHARIVESETRAVLDMPALSGTLTAGDGQRVRIVDLEHATQTVLHVRQSVVPVERRTTPGTSTLRRMTLEERLAEGRFELVNPERREGIVLTASYDRNAETASVLPASHARTTYITLSIRDDGQSRPRRFRPDDEWMAGARLRYVVPIATAEYTVNVVGRITRIGAP
jgi:hypothetical protein